MTTIIGLKAEKGKKSTRGVILGSDYTITSTIPEDRGNVIYKRQVTNPFGKLYNGKGDRFVAGFTGVIDNTSIPFIKDLLDGKFDLEKAIAEGKFPEIRDMNLSRWGMEKTNKRTNRNVTSLQIQR